MFAEKVVEGFFKQRLAGAIGVDAQQPQLFLRGFIDVEGHGTLAESAALDDGGPWLLFSIYR